MDKDANEPGMVEGRDCLKGYARSITKYFYSTRAHWLFGRVSLKFAPAIYTYKE